MLIFGGVFNRKIPILTNTPPKFNIAPQKWWLEDYFPIGKVPHGQSTWHSPQKVD